MATGTRVQNPNEGYRFRKPRRINFVSLLLIVGGVLAVYGAVRFAPVYWKRYKVDRALQEAATRSDSISLMNPETQRKLENDALVYVYKEINDLGINTTPVEQGGNGLRVYFDPNYARIRAQYTVVVKHPFGKRTVMKFDRSEKVPTNMKFK